MNDDLKKYLQAEFQHLRKELATKGHQSEVAAAVFSAKIDFIRTLLLRYG